MKTMGWKRSTDEPLERRFSVSVSEATLQRLRLEGARRGVSAAEMARGFILAGIEELDQEEAGE